MGRSRCRIAIARQTCHIAVSISKLTGQSIAASIMAIVVVFIATRPAFPTLFCYLAARKPDNITAVHTIIVRWSTPAYASLVILRAASVIIRRISRREHGSIGGARYRSVGRVWYRSIRGVWYRCVGWIWHGRISRVWYRSIRGDWYRCVGWIWHGRISGIGRCWSAISRKTSIVVVLKLAGKSITATISVRITVCPAAQTGAIWFPIWKPTNVRILAIVA